MSLERLWKLFHQASPQDVDVPDRRARMDCALRALAEEGVLKLPSRSASNWDVLGIPALPQFITVAAADDQKAAGTSTNDWVPALQVLGSTTNPRRLADLRRINEFLIAHPDGPATLVPYRERALELFGDEKYFDGKVKAGRLYGELPLEVLGARVPAGPLAFVRCTDAPRGAPILVVENQHSYASLVEWNSKCHLFAAVALGNGQAVRQAVSALHDLVQATGASEALYFGDLDPTGVAIAAGFSDACEATAVGSVRPWLAAYRWLLANGSRKPLSLGKRQGADTAWLAELAGEAQALFQGLGWIPQESLSLDALNLGVDVLGAHEETGPL